MYATVFGNVTVIVNRIYATQARYHQQKARVKEFIRFHRISKELMDHVMDSFERIWKYTHGIDMQLVSDTKLNTGIVSYLHFHIALSGPMHGKEKNIL